MTRIFRVGLSSCFASKIAGSLLLGFVCGVHGQEEARRAEKEAKDAEAKAAKVLAHIPLYISNCKGLRPTAAAHSDRRWRIDVAPIQ